MYHIERIKLIKFTSTRHRSFRDQFQEERKIIKSRSGRNALSHSAARIAQLSPFASLDADALDALAHISRIRRYAPGEIITLEGDITAPVFFVLEGVVRVFRTNLEGREQTVIYLRPGEAFNLPSAFLDAPATPASTMAEEETRVVTMDLNKLREVAYHWPDVAMALLKDLSAKLQHLSALTYSLSLLSVRARLARFLLSQGYGEDDTPERWTHAQIAARIGTVRVVVSRTLSALADENLIRLDRQRIEIIDPQGLTEIAEL